MRRYFLAKQDSRRDVDLRDYAQSIRDAVILSLILKIPYLPTTVLK